MEAFFARWTERLEQLYQELISACSGVFGNDDDRLRRLVDCTLAHYSEYYQERRRLAERDVLLVYSPVWLTPFERTFLWIAGWRPSLTFRLLGAVGPAAAPGIREIEAQAVEEEARLSREMTNLQEAMAAPLVMAVMRRSAEVRNGQPPPEEDEVVGPLLRSLLLLLERADNLRVTVVKRLAQILSTKRMVDLLTAATHLHLRVRAWGMRLQGAAAEAAA
ncbi:unnamed protein product [Spirodela intermedia]|uniref:DOG1 domain-containing protein n=1 Tax=Spirodela intermedia TaxID=51605 RepID=A0A7I8LFV0_SPIIN|nr:unnamed protein product [Spirodela intermedia]